MAEPARHHTPYWPAAMRAERAAAYLDVSATWFQEHVAPEIVSLRPTRGVVLYRRLDLDLWLDRQAGGGQAYIDPKATIHAHIQKTLAKRR